MAKDPIKTQWVSEALSWDREKARWQRRVFVGVSVLSLVLFALVVSLSVALTVGLARLRQPVTLLLHERDDGRVAYVRVATPPRLLPASLAQLKSDCAQYVTLRERYVASDLASQFEAVAVRSTPELRVTYKHQLEHDRFVHLGETGTQSVVVHHVLILSQAKPGEPITHNVAEVYFTTTESLTRKPHRQRAVLQWSYGPVSEKTAVFFHNPLGFQVHQYDVFPVGVEDFGLIDTEGPHVT